MTGNSNTEQSRNHVEPEETPKRPARPRRRWRRRLAIGFLVLVVLLIVLIGFAPSIASTRAVSAYAISLVNNQLVGSIRLQKLSLSWGGPISVSGVQVFDADRREVMQVPKITCAAGLWRLLTSAETFGEIAVDAPQVDLHLTPANEITLVQALQPMQPSPKVAAEAGPLPEPRGRFVVRDGTVRVTREGAATYEMPEVHCEVALDTLAKVDGTFELAFPDGRQLRGNGNVRDLFSAGKLDIRGASGALSVRTDGDIALGPLAEVVAPEIGLTGTVSPNVTATVAGGDLQGKFEVNVRRLQTRQRAAGKAQPLDLGLTGQAEMTAERLAARTRLTGAAGDADVTFSYHFSDRPLDITLDRVLAAVLNGEAIDLPDFSLEARARLDLAALENALPGLLHIRPDQRITAGTLEVATLTAEGGPQPVVRGAIELKDVAARSGDRTFRLQPVACRFDMGLTAGTGLEVRQAALTSSFAELNAQGTAAALHGDFRTDLARLRQELGAVFDVEALNLAGDLQGALKLARVGGERLDISAEIIGAGVQYGAQDRRLDLRSARITHAGHVTLADGKPRRYAATSSDVDLNGEVVVAASGWYDMEQEGFHVAIDLKRADLDFVARQSEALGMDELGRYAGTLSMQSRIDRSAGGEPVTSGGNLAARGLTVDGHALAADETRVTWRDVRLAADATNVRAEQVRLESELATLTAENLHWQSGDHLVLNGTFDSVADLAGCLRAAALITKMEEPPALAGRLRLRGAGTTTGAVVSLTGDGDIDQLEVGTGDQAVRQQRLQIEYAGDVDRKNERIALHRTRITSAPFTAEVAGTIEQYRTAVVLALSGRYDASWKELMAILHELVPATASTILINGTSTSQFRIEGPVRAPGGESALRELAGGLDIRWDSAELYGVPLGAARLSPTLRDGRVTLPTAAIAASQGRVNLGGVLDLRPAEPTLRMPGRTKLLEDVAITQELSTSLLSRINPIFLHLTRVEGRAGLRLKDLTLPLGESVKTAGAGEGQLELVEMKAQPGGLLAELLALGGLTDQELYAVTVSGLRFLVHDGRISYKDFTLTFPNGFDLKFYGSVGFDETLDLSVSLPVRPELLARLGVKGPVAEYARVLTGSRIDIPLVGTRQKPRLDLRRADIKALIERAVRETAGQRLEGLLRGLFDDTKKEPDSEAPQSRRP